MSLPISELGGDRILAVPQYIDQWMRRARACGIETKSLRSPRLYRSASRMQEEQYLLLRTIWSSFSVENLNVDNEVGTYYREEAALMLEDSRDWKSYMDELSGLPQGRKLPIPDVGMFSMALHEQRDITQAFGAGEEGEAAPQKLYPGRALLAQVDNEDERDIAREGLTPRKRRPPTRLGVQPDLSDDLASEPTPVTPMTNMMGALKISRSDDNDDDDYVESEQVRHQHEADSEATVNQALTLWLNALLTLCRDNEIHCRSRRATFRFAENWKALTDGVLCQLGEDKNILAILEAKRYRRLGLHQNVRRQEAGEMVCWIWTDKDDRGCYIIEESSGKRDTSAKAVAMTRYKRLLIAQDCDEIWFTVAVYDDRYRKYVIDDGPADGETFLHMREYGPFSIWNTDDMQKAATFLLAFFLRQNQRQLRQEQRLAERRTRSERRSRSESERRRLPSKSRSRVHTSDEDENDFLST